MREDTVDKKTLASSSKTTSTSSSSVNIRRLNSFPNSASSKRIALTYEDDEKEQQIAFSY